MIVLTNIQRTSFHDGPGIRATVFLKGCSLRCPWCSNPENLHSEAEQYIKDGVSGTYGYILTPDELFDEVMKDQIFYGEYHKNEGETLDSLPGGVTFSGGEALIQINELAPLLERLREEHIHIAVETCLFIPRENLEKAIELIDLFYVDVKILDEMKCKEKLKGHLPLYFSNFDHLIKSEKPVVIRIPVIGGYTDNEENRRSVVAFLDKYKEYKNLLKVEIIKEHNLGVNKYKSLKECNDNWSIPDYKGVSDELMNRYKDEIIKKLASGVEVEICKI